MRINVPTINDARRRFLKPGGIFIPQRDVVYVSLISAPLLYQKNLLEPWLENDYQLDLSAGHAFARNRLHMLKPDKLPPPLFPPQVWADIDYRTNEDPNAHARIEWVSDKACTVHFLVIWFDTYLFEDIGYTSSPWKERSTLYACDALPMQEPLEIAPNDLITLELHANLVQGEYIFTWNTSLKQGGKTKVEFRQSTLLGKILTNRFTKR